jgi:hypothetical protein
MSDKRTSTWLGVSVTLNVLLVIAVVYCIYTLSKNPSPSLTSTTVVNPLKTSSFTFRSPDYNNPVAEQEAGDRAGNYRNDPKYGGTLHSFGEWYSPGAIAEYLLNRLPIIEGRLGYPVGSPLPTNCVWVIGHYYCVTKINNSDSLKLLIIPSLYDTVKHQLHDVISKDALYTTLAPPKPGTAHPLTSPTDSIAYDAGHLWPPN